MIKITSDKMRKRMHEVMSRLNRSIGRLKENEARLPHGFAARPSFDRASCCWLNHVNYGGCPS
jgi:hypothetical protein